jgi:hypothetical protein
MMEVPAELVPAVRELIEHYRKRSSA